MMWRRLSVLAGVCLAMATVSARAAELWDPAPPLKIAEWVKGKKVDLKDGKGKQVYVVEFWATWCGPCKLSIPHLTELQKKFGDKATFIGVSTEETGTVKKFVKQMADKMDYTVAVDDDKATDKAYMQAYGQNGIPCAFVIDKQSRVVWLGNPLIDPIEDVVKLAIDDKYDKKAGKEMEAKAEKMHKEFEEKQQKAMEKMQTFQRKAMQYFKMAMKKDVDKEKASKLGAELADLTSDNPGAQNFVAWNILAEKKLKYRDKALALKLAKSAFDATKGQEPAIVDTYARALYDNGKAEQAIKAETDALALCTDKNMKKEFQETIEMYKSGKPGKMESQLRLGGDDDEDDDAKTDDHKKGKDKDDMDKDD